jgi:hypothetical protein
MTDSDGDASAVTGAELTDVLAKARVELEQAAQPDDSGAEGGAS